jgi:exonuclease V gamma subunit
MEEWVRIELRRGTLPNDALGDALIGDLAARVPALITAAESCGFSNRAEGWLPIDVVLADGTRLVGSVPNKLESPGAGPARILLSSTKEHQRVAASVDLLALVATDPSAHWRSLVVSRGKKGPHIRDLLPLDGGQGIGSMARETLEVVVDCYRRGCREPLPLFPNLSPKVFDHTAKATDWRSWDGRSDGDKVATALAYGDYDYRALLAVPARDADPPGPGNRVERYATYLYGALQMAVDTV